MAALTIRLLGPFEISVDGRPADVSGPKRRALVALLALRRGRVVSVDAIVDAIWGEDLPAAPANAVQHHVTRLRQALGPEALAASPEGYALRGAEVDALRFEELLAEARACLRDGDARAASAAAEAALGFWRGSPLLGLPEATWVSDEQTRLEALRLDLLEERFEALLALGEHATLVPPLRDALGANAFRERLWGQLMLALYRAGRQADALEAFQQARRTLGEQLGLEPGPELQRLQTAILAQDPAIAPVPVRRRRGNLPSPLTSFVGRTRLLGELEQLVRTQRLVTLCGPPGVGKSRLALEAARAVEADFDDVWLVELRRADDAADVPRLAVGVVEGGSAPATGEPIRRLTQRLRDAETLLVLDECERVTHEIATLASTVLTECPGARVLATSRELLGVPGEHRVAVEPLALTSDDDGGADDVGEAVQLFVERARAARSGFRTSPADDEIVADICRLVDGLPAAIELAAARVNVLGLREIRSGLEHRSALLRADRRGAGEGFFATLVDWSYELLHADEKAVLQQLAVFRGGADLEAVLAMTARLELDEVSITRLLATLVEKSIVTASFSDGGARYDLLTAVRDYVLERLDASGELATFRKAHAEHFATLAAEARTELNGPDWPEWTARLALEHDNLWAALAYARDASDPGVAIRLGASLGFFFLFAARVSEGRRFLEVALAAAPEDAPVDLRVELLAFLSYLATEESDLDAALELGERALALAAAIPSSTEAATARIALSAAVALSGDHERATRLVREATETYEAAGDHRGAAMALVVGAWGAVGTGNAASVAAFAADALRLSEPLDYLPALVPATLLAAWVAERRDDLDGAATAYGRAVELAGRAGFTDHSAFALVRLGAIALARGDRGRAEELERRALTAAEAAQAVAVAAHARVQLGRVLAAAGDADAAERVYRDVVGWSGTPRMRRGRETIFDAVGGDPAAAAYLGLAEIADARGDGAAAAEFRGHAQPAPA